MKKLSAIAAFLMLASCGHNKPVADLNQVSDRAPSNERTQAVKSCGYLTSSETSRNAVDVNSDAKIDDRFIVLQVDCNKDGVVDLDSEKQIVGVPTYLVSPQQKGWITRWRKIAIKQQRNQAAKPYVCMDYTAWSDPCTSGKNVYGVSPKFSSKVVVKKVK